MIDPTDELDREAIQEQREGIADWYRENYGPDESEWDNDGERSSQPNRITDDDD